MISVIMPTFNTPKEMLEQAINSILNQTYGDFEFIIINDCSTDDTAEYLRTFSDKRIRVIENQKNLGITKSLNVGIREAKGEYIARMDSDDIAYPERFEKQLKFMQDNPSVIVCGTWIQAFGSKNYTAKRVLPNREYLACSFVFGNIYGLSHPTAFFRADLLKQNDVEYNEELPTAQDYGMWTECVKYGEIANVSEVLLSYRVHDSQVSIAKKELQESCVKKVQKNLLTSLMGEISDEQLEKHFKLCKNINYSKNTLRWFKVLKKANAGKKVYDKKVFNKVASDVIKSKIKNSAVNAKSLKGLIKLFFSVPISKQGLVLKTAVKRLTRKKSV
ncbi:MAG: glycosyltransferase family 2 protein [Clostridia bacterium]|nr:glycosyltransferase family 2 protein [Clostridia bacterium]